MKSNKRWQAAALIGSLMIWVVSCTLQDQSSAASAALGQPLEKAVHPSAGVHGTVIVQTPPGAAAGSRRSGSILMPGFEVFLRDTTTNRDTEPVVSDMMGRFEFKPVPNGRYELRWKAQKGWAAGTYPTPVVIRGHVFYAHSVILRPEDGKGVITGSVQLADGTTPWFYSEEHGLVRAATVSTVDAGTNRVLAAPVIANHAGQFAIAGIDRASTPKLVASSEAAREEKALPVGVFTNATTTAPVTIIFKNHRPRILDMSALINGQRVRSAAPGATVQIKANVVDANMDTLEIKWTTSSGTVSGGPVTDGVATADWKLPSQPGVYTLTLLVTDGKGGAMTKRFSIDSGKQSNTFSGVVVSSRGTPIAGAQVTVNGTATVSRNDGTFKVTPKVTKKYVLNIYKPGFTLLSRLLDFPVSRLWRLVPSQLQKVDVGKQITLVDKRPGIQRKKLGGTFQLGGGRLVTPNGKKATGMVTVELATIDLANDEMPGDLLASLGGRDVGLVSFGALWVQFTNAAGKKLQLAPGAAATVTIPVPPAMRASAPKKMAVWSYDETDGRWKPSGKATYAAAKQAYVGTVTHLSTINMDQSGPVSCIRVHTDIGLPAGLTLRVSDVPGGVEFAQVKSMVLTGEINRVDGPLNAVYRVPASTQVKFEILNDSGVLVSGSPRPMVVVEDGDTRGIGNGTVLPDNIVTSDPEDPSNPNLWPDYPYSDCKAVTLKLFPRWGSYPESSFFIRRAPLPGEPGGPGATDATAEAYYDAIDPNNLRRNLGDWWGQNGFNTTNGAPAPASGEPLTNYARTSYLNNNDLGSGRDMHFHRSPDGTLSAFVTNYSRNVAFDQRPEFADDALDGIASLASNPGATVCMEYKPVEGDPTSRRIVKFFVFAGNGNGPAASYQKAADLDGFGARFVPGLCINCHGYGSAGGYFNPDPATLADVDFGASFRELDLETYHFPGNRLTPNAAEQFATRLQNLMIRDTAIAPAPVLMPPQNPVARGPIVDLITGWYAAGGNQDNSFTPNGPSSGLPAGRWGSAGSQSHNLYHGVIKVSCRTCHIAFDSSPDEFGLDWNRYDQMSLPSFRNGLIRDYVVGGTPPPANDRIMPHALVTYRNFWLQTTVAPNPQGSRAQRLWEYSDGAAWTAFGPPTLP